MLKDKPKFVKLDQLVEFSEKSLDALEKWSDQGLLDFFQVAGKEDKIYELEETLEKIKEIEEGKNQAEKPVETSAEEVKADPERDSETPARHGSAEGELDGSLGHGLREDKNKDDSGSSILKKIFRFRKK